MKFAFVFPGQGSQSPAMMSAWGDSAVVRAAFDEASAALGRDLWTLAAEGDAAALAQTVNTQPLMLAAGVALWRLWLDKGGARPAMLAGHSLGEYSALVAAQVIDLATAAPLVQLRATAMQEAVPAGVGAMAAILGLAAPKVQEICAGQSQDGAAVAQAVNFNSPEQTVIAGHRQAVEAAAQACKEQGAKRAVLLPVSAPFHSTLMQPAAEKLQQALAQIDFRAPRIAVINNVDAAVVDDPQQIKAALVRQAAAPVRWVETMQAMRAAGVSHVFECGPGKVLSGLTKRCADGLGGGAMNDLAALEATLALVKE